MLPYALNPFMSYTLPIINATRMVLESTRPSKFLRRQQAAVIIRLHAGGALTGPTKNGAIRRLQDAQPIRRLETAAESRERTAPA